ncbi:formimidoylglutamase [Altibacter sp. HG106]|uniref:formimidoylglutamase n=1 Tax=Altibacter sp. HG106 TaxID=3023937 RepID=UPI002350850A|nr:formimidoylglutamase [Altibacter sp. HG106]MDC7995525.1 formimidoylglutamase [Altibacter sp. HG106]
MSALHHYSKEKVQSYIQLRKGEKKFGESVHTVTSLSELKDHAARFVLFGIPEDIGVRANHGKPGAAKAWQACLSNLLNMQSNTHTNPEALIVLGEIDCAKEMKTADMMDPTGATYFETLGRLVEKIDQQVSEVVRAIVHAGKIPIIVGGGHNNAFGNLKGASEALGTALNAINFDAHTDFRPLEHRHSGNGFSFAMDRGFLQKYAVFGLHKSYTSQEIYDRMNQFKGRAAFYFFEDMEIMEQLTVKEAMLNAKNFLGMAPFGLEFDVDAIENFPSSAMTPSGFSMKDARTFLRYFSRRNGLTYVHICEAAMTNEATHRTGKALAYLVNDVISD